MTTTTRSLESATDLCPALGEHICAQREDMRAMVAQLVREGGLTEARYARLLSCFVHLTRGVQRHFFAVAGHDSLQKREELREFLLHFGKEEEWHWRVAVADLEALGYAVSEPPVEVDLWWSYFDRMVVERPFVRLGAAALLENLGDSVPSGGAGVMSGPFLRPDTTRFYRIHSGDAHSHGAELLAALADANPTAMERADMVRGAEAARRLHLGALRSALFAPDVAPAPIPSRAGGR